MRHNVSSNTHFLSVLLVKTLIVALAFSGLGCVGPAPVKDYNLAYTAVRAAKDIGSPRHAPGYWARAQKAYRQALKHYQDREYKEARAQFKEARLFAERAENFTALKKMREGGE